MRQQVKHRNLSEPEYYPWLTMGIASLMLFFLLVEWLRPMQQASAITQVYLLEPFQLALFGFVALDYLRIHGLLLWPLKLAVALLVISVFYYDSYLYERAWWDKYIAITLQDIESLANNHTSALSGENRTLLLLIGSSLVIYSLHYIVVRRQYVGWFVAVTIGYLAGLQILFGLPTTSGILVSLAAGLLMIVLLQPVRWRSILSMTEQESVANGDSASGRRGHRAGSESANTARGKETNGESDNLSLNQSTGGKSALAARGTSASKGIHNTTPDQKAGGVIPATALGMSAVGDSTKTAVHGATSLLARASAAAKPAAGYAGAICIAAAALTAGWLAAEDQPKLSQPLRWNVAQFTQDVARLTNGRWSIPAGQDWSNLANISVTGFAPGDYELGGSVIPANYTIFTARSEKMTYWRGETRDYYDGTAWHDKPAGNGDSIRESAGSVDGKPDHTSFLLPQTLIEQEIHLDSTAAIFLRGTLFAGGEITEVVQLVGSSDENLDPQLYPLQRDELSQRYVIDTGEVVLGSYRIAVHPVPHDNLDAHLINEAYRAAVEQGTVDNPQKQQIDEAHSSAEPATALGLSDEERLRYTQLPEMSERVYELAAQLTAGAATDLDKARAIAAYLRANYAYDLNATEKPEGVEFVEHFLFEQRAGYCDHFSTAMAVLLRMNGIPSRWVTGFAPGDVSIDEYGYVWSEVRALHAHSWAEAYIAGIGWVAFEPTPSYAGSLEAASVVLAAESSGSNDTLSEREWWQGPALILASEVTKEVDEMDVDWLAWLEMKWSDWKESLMSIARVETAIWAAIAAAAIALIVILLVLLRHRLTYIRLERRISQMERRGGTALLLELMWQRIIRKYGPIQPGQTLREYVEALELRKPEQREALAELALLYEAIRYDARLPERISRGRMSRLWREAIG